MGTSTWKTAVGGDWSNAADWKGPVPDSATTPVEIAATGSYTVTIGASESFTAGSLIVKDAGANLAIAGSLSLAAGLTLTAGSLTGAGTLSLAGGTIQAGSGATLSIANLVIDTANAVTLGSALTDSGGLTLSAGTFALGANTLTLGSFAQTSGTISGAGIVTVTGSARFGNDDDQESGPGTTVLQGATSLNGTIGNPLVVLDGGRILENAGTLTVTGSAGAFFDLGFNAFGPSAGGGTLRNDASATLDIQVDGQIVQSNAGTTAFTNAGTVTKSAGTGTSFIAAPFASTGTIAVASGTLEFDGGGTIAGTVAGSGTLAFGGPGSVDAIAAGTTLSVAALAVYGATVQIGAGLAYSGTLTETSGDLALGTGSSFTISGATLSGGTIDGAGSLATVGSTSIAGNDVTFGSAVWSNTGTLTIAGAGDTLGVAGTTWTNTGTIAGNGIAVNFGGNWTTAGTVGIKSSTVDFQGGFLASVLDQLSGKGDTLTYGASAIVDNIGHTIKVGASSNLLGTASVGFTIRNGVVNDAGGLLAWTNGTLDGVTYQGVLGLTQASATVDVVDGLTLAGSSGTGAGTINLTGAGAGLIMIGTQTLDNATVNLGTTSANPGSIDDRDAGAAGSVLTLGKNLKIVVGGNAQIQSSTGGTGGTLNPGDSVVNNGRVTDNGQLLIDCANFANAGTVTVSSKGSLDIGVYGHANGFANAAAGTITLGSGTAADLGAADSTANNAGTIAASGATVSFNGTWTNTGTLSIGKSNVSLNGTFTGVAFIALFGNKTDQVTLNGTYENAGQTLTIGTGTAIGTIVLGNGATIAGGAIVDKGAGLALAGGTLEDTTYQGTLDLSADDAALTIVGGLAMTGPGGKGTGTVNDSGLGSTLDFSGSGVFDNATVAIGNDGGNPTDASTIVESDPNGILTLGSTTTIDQTGLLAALGDAQPGGATGTIVNDGAIVAGLAGGDFSIAPASFVNNGSIAVSNGDALAIDPAGFSNTGTIAVTSGGSIDFQGDLTTAELGTVTNSGGILRFDGTLDNTGATLDFGAGAVLVGGTITNGTIAGTALAGGGGTLDGVAYQGTIDLSGYAATLTIADGLTMAGTGGTGAGMIVDTGPYSDLMFAGTETLDNATITLGNNAYSLGYASTIAETDPNGILTLGPGVTIDHVGLYADLGYQFYFDVGTGTIVNQGTIVANLSGGYFDINPVAFTNAGSITVSNGDALYIDSTFVNTGTVTVSGALLDLRGNLTTAQLGTIDAATGTLTIGGRLDNTGATLDFGAGTVFIAGTIVGGTIIASAVSGAGGILDGVTYQGPLDLTGYGAALGIADGLTITGTGGTGGGAIGDTGIASDLSFAGTQTFDNAAIDLGNSYYDSYYASAVSESDPNGILTLGAHIAIDQVGLFADVGYDFSGSVGTGTIVNDGSIIAGFAHGTLTIDPVSFSNAGSIVVSNGTRLFIDTTTFANTGTISVASGSLVDFQGTVTTAALLTIAASPGAFEIDGTLDNTASVLNIGAGTALGTVALAGTILGGTIVDAGAGLTTGGGTLDGVIYNGTLDLSGSGASLYLVDGFNIGGGAATVRLVGSGSALYAGNTETIDNATIDIGSGSPLYGTIQLQDILGTGETLTLGANLDIVQAGAYAEIDSSGYAGDAIVNDGTITAGVAGGQFDIAAVAFTNDGAIAVTGGDTLAIDSTSFTNAGSITAGGGGTAYLQPTAFTNVFGGTLTGGTYEADAGSIIELGQNLAITTLDATVILSGAGSVLESDSTVTAQEIGIDASLTAIGPGGTLELRGGRSFTTTAAFANQGALTLGSAVFTAASLANMAGASLGGQGVVAAAIVNGGVIESLGGGTLELQDAVSGAGQLIVGAGTTLQLDSTLAPGGVNFAGAGATLAIGDIAGFQGTIGGLAGGDAIDLLNTAATAVVLDSSNRLVVTNGGAPVVTLQLAGSANGDFDYSVGTDGKGGTDLLIAADQPPVTTAPATLGAVTGAPTPVAGVSVADGDAVAQSETITIVITDTVGLLSAKAQSGATVTGSGTRALTLAGSLAGVDAELATLVYKGVLTGTAASATDTIAIAANDGRGGTSGATVAVKINHVPPVVAAASPQKVLSGQATAIAGFALTDTDPLSEAGKFTVTLTDKHGTLSATAEAGATVAGAGTAKLVLAGSLAAVQAELGTVTYTGGATGTKATLADTITINALDGRGGKAVARSTNVTIGHLPPVTSVPAAVKVASNVATPIAGISVADADPTAGSSTFTVTVTDKLGLLSATAAAGATVAGNDSKKLTLSGSLAGVDAELSTLAYLDKLSAKATSAADTITVTTKDSYGLGDTHSIGVTVTPTGSIRPSLALLIQAIAAFGGDGAGMASSGPRVDETPHWLAHGH